MLRACSIQCLAFLGLVFCLIFFFSDQKPYRHGLYHLFDWLMALLILLCSLWVVLFDPALKEFKRRQLLRRVLEAEQNLSATELNRFLFTAVCFGDPACCPDCGKVFSATAFTLVTDSKESESQESEQYLSCVCGVVFRLTISGDTFHSEKISEPTREPTSEPTRESASEPVRDPEHE